MDSEDEKREENTKKIQDSIKGLIVIVAVLVGLYFAIYYIHNVHPEYIDTFIDTVRYELIAIIFLCALIIVISNCISIMRSIIKKYNEGKNYFIDSIVLLLCSLFVLKKTSYSTHDIMDLLLDGEIFALPALFLLVIPILILCILSIKHMLLDAENGSNWGEEVQKIKKETIKLASGIVLSLLHLAKFVTVDFLEEIKNFLMTEIGIQNTDIEENANDDELLNRSDAREGQSDAAVTNKSGILSNQTANVDD